MVNTFRFLPLSLLALLGSALPGHAVDPAKIATPKFTTAPSCNSSYCHGGGVGKDQSVIYAKEDRHRLAHAILATARSARIAEGLNIPDATKAARCTVCHSPMTAVPPLRFVQGAKPDVGVSCESCHGAAEPWLRFHTRPDVNHDQRVAAGLREMSDFYSRANACIACHMNIDADLVAAGHPEMFFDLDRQMTEQKPHYKDEGTWLGPRAWFTGQAAALRELSWKLAKSREPNLEHRFRAIGWLLRKTDEGASVPETDDFAAVQGISERLARAAARQQWSKEKAQALLRKLATIGGEFRDSKLESQELRRRGEVLTIGIDRLWYALKKEGGLASDTFDKALAVLSVEARSQAGFEPAKFAAALEQIEVALELLPKN